VYIAYWAEGIKKVIESEEGSDFTDIELFNATSGIKRVIKKR